MIVDTDQREEILKRHVISHARKKCVCCCYETRAFYLFFTFVHGLFKITALSAKKEVNISRPFFPKTCSSTVWESI